MQLGRGFMTRKHALDACKLVYFSTKSSRVARESEHSELKLDLDLNEPVINGANSNTGFKYDELIICKISEDIKDTRVKHKLFKLQANSILSTKCLDLLHEHIVHKSGLTPHVSFQIKQTRLEFKRPSLYEYVNLRLGGNAVPSHFSIVSLVPLLLELSKGARVLESGTGSGCMSLFLSQHLGQFGSLYTFDIKESSSLAAKRRYLEWKQSYDLHSHEKWPSNVKYGCCDLARDERLDHLFSSYFDAIYLDMGDLDLAVARAQRLLKPGGVLVVNGMHLTQIIKCLNSLEQSKGLLKLEMVLEPANRFWELSRVKKRRTDHTITELDWSCRLEDKFLEKIKRGGLFFNYWQGFLAKFRRIK